MLEILPFLGPNKIMLLALNVVLNLETDNYVNLLFYTKLLISYDFLITEALVIALVASIEL